MRKFDGQGEHGISVSNAFVLKNNEIVAPGWGLIFLRGGCCSCAFIVLLRVRVLGSFRFGIAILCFFLGEGLHIAIARAAIFLVEKYVVV